MWNRPVVGFRLGLPCTGCGQGPSLPAWRRLPQNAYVGSVPKAMTLLEVAGPHFVYPDPTECVLETVDSTTTPQRRLAGLIVLLTLRSIGSSV